MEEPFHLKDPDRLTRAHVAPLAVFMGFSLVLQLAISWIGWDHPSAPWWRRNPAHFIYPVQTLVALGVLGYYWKNYDFRWSLKWSAAAIIFGAVGIGFWLLPTTLYDHWHLSGEPGGWLGVLGVRARLDGYNPDDFTHPAAWWSSVMLRFLRAVVVVALAEEILWRGFMMRFVCDFGGNYWRQPFGRPTWLSYGVVTGLFVLAHTPDDYAGAFVYGSLTYLFCIWSRNLGACVVMHATANLLMCLYIMAYGKFGLW